MMMQDEDAIEDWLTEVEVYNLIFLTVRQTRSLTILLTVELFINSNELVII